MLGQETTQIICEPPCFCGDMCNINTGTRLFHGGRPAPMRSAPWWPPSLFTLPVGPQVWRGWSLLQSPEHSCPVTPRGGSEGRGDRSGSKKKIAGPPVSPPLRGKVRGSGLSVKWGQPVKLNNEDERTSRITRKQLGSCQGTSFLRPKPKDASAKLEEGCRPLKDSKIKAGTHIKDARGSWQCAAFSL